MYAIVGYQTAYLKNYYPAEWMAACIETDKDQESSIEEYKKECARLGVKILEPNVNESGLTTTVSKDGIIYAPITSVKGVGESGSSITLNKPYDNLEDFIERSGCKKSLYTALAASGALNCLIKDEEDLDETYFIDFWIEYAEKKKKLKKQSSKSGVNNNSLSLFELKDLSKARESQNSDILSMLEDF
jgi:DNA polymerase-3 subunit alpha